MTMPTPEAPRSCASCPGCATQGRQRELYGADFGPGTDLCTSLGMILSNPLHGDSNASVNLQIKRRQAESCPKYGRNDPAVANPTALVAIPERFAPATELGALSNCHSCKHYVPSDVVRADFGWNNGLCAATGRLLLSNRLTYEARECSYGEAGANRASTFGLAISPVLDPDSYLTVAVDSSSATSILDTAFVEPLEWPTDRKVTDADRADGILSWRKITHPRLGDLKDPIWLPVFNPDFFTEAEQSMIPKTGDVEHPELYVDHQGLIYKVAVAMLGIDKAPVLTGEAGIGKTELYRHLAWMCQVPFVRINLTKTSEVEDVIGKWLFLEGQTTWKHGRLSKAYSHPRVVCIDEWNTAPDAILQFLRPLTDNSKQLVLDAEEGTEIKRHDFLLLGFSQNPSWDLKNTGTNQLANADEERCSWIAVDLPSEEIERSIILRWCEANGYELPAKTLDAIMEIAVDIRKLTDPRSPSLSISWGIRPQIAVAQLTQYFTLMEAYKMTVIDRLDPAQGDVIRNFVTRFES